MNNNQTRTDMKNIANKNSKKEVTKTAIVFNECQKRLRELDSYLISETSNQIVSFREPLLTFFSNDDSEVLNPSFSKDIKSNSKILNSQGPENLTDSSSISESNESNCQDFIFENEIENIMESKLMEIELEGLLEDTVLEESVKGINLSPILDEDEVLESISRKENFELHLRMALLSIDGELTTNQLSKLTDFVLAGLKLVSVSRQN
jgi:hypothetical protein